MEIFEGDILSDGVYPHISDGKQNYVSIVEWIFAGFQTVLRCVNPDVRGISDGINETLEEGDGWLVIGNRWDNPILLEVQP